MSDRPLTAAELDATLEALDGAALSREEQALRAEEQRKVCKKCRTPFDPTDARFDGHAQKRDTPYCRRCVDRCHDTEIADHRCVICGGGQ